MKSKLVGCAFATITLACGDSGTTPDAGGDASTDSSLASDVSPTDSQPVDATLDAAVDAGPLCDPTKPFGAPVMLTTLNLHADAGAAAGNTRQPRLSSDLRTAYFNDGSSIYAATRATPNGDAFGAPTPLASITGDGGIDTSPTISPNGLTMYFASTRTGTSALYVSTRANATDPFPAPSVVSGMPAVSVLVPFLEADGATLYFADGTNVYRANVSGATATNATTLTEFAGAQSVSGGIVVTGDGLTAYFSRAVGTDGGAIGHYKIWSATRASTSAPFGSFTYATELDTPSDDVLHNDDIAWISSDGCVALLTSFRDVGSNVYEARKPQ